LFTSKRQNYISDKLISRTLICRQFSGFPHRGHPGQNTKFSIGSFNLFHICCA